MENATKLLESLPKFKSEKQRRIAIQLTGVALISCVICTAYKLISNESKKKTAYKEIPVPGSSYPYVGHMFSLGEVPAQKVSQWHAKYGPIIKFYMGVQTWITIDDPFLAYKVFIRNGIHTSNRPDSLFMHDYFSIGGNGVAFSQPGPVYNKNRSAALSVLSPKVTVEKYTQLIIRECEDLVSRLTETSELEGSVDSLKYLTLSSLNVVFSTCFGKRFDDIRNPEFVKVAKMIEGNTKYAGSASDVGHFLPIVSIFEFLSLSQVKKVDFMRNCRDPMYKQWVEEAATQDGSNLIKSLDEDGFDFTVEEKMAFTVDMVTAGTDVASVGLYGIFNLMCNYPEVQEEVADEIDRFVKLNGHIPDFTEREQVPYCISVIKECLRFKPIQAFGLPHVTQKDIEVDGYVIPKGATIMANMKTLHRSPEFYPNDPNKFIPDRFMNNTKTFQSAASGKLANRDIFIFGFGRRMCPGITLADAEIFCSFVQVFSRAFIEPVDKMPDTESEIDGGITLIPSPYKVKFVKRNASTALHTI